MAGKFEPVTLVWKDREYVIPANRIMGAIARIEDVITLSELKKFHDRGGAPLAKLATALAEALTYAGATVQSEDVYAAMFGSQEEQVASGAAIVALLQVMTPPGSRPGNAPAPAPTTTPAQAGRSGSRKRGKR